MGLGVFVFLLYFYFWAKRFAALHAVGRRGEFLD